MSGDLELLGERIAEQAAHLDAAMHRLLADLRAFDEGDGWYHQGARSCAQWLSWRVGWGLGTAREHLRTAHALAKLPLVDRELAHGRLSYSKVRAITRVATADNEATLVEQAKLATASQLETICRKYATVRRQERAANAADDRDRRRVTRWDLPDGMVKIEAVLHAEEAALVWTALEHAAKQRYRNVPAETREASVPAESSAANVPAEPRSATVPAETCATDVRAEPREANVPAEPRATDVPAETCAADVPAATRTDAVPAERRRPAFDRADALVALADGYLRGDAPDRAPVELIVAIPLETLARGNALEPTDVACTRDGTCISAHAARRLACDAGIVPLVEDEHGTPLSVGRKSRSLPGALKRALLARDGHRCQFPGCTNRVYLEGHHLEHWAEGGETKLENMLTICSYHHRFLHEYEYAVEIGADGTAIFRDHNGHIVPSAPAPAATSSHLGWDAIRLRNERLAITAATNEPGWDGYPVDYVACIDELVVADGLS